jgi:hypothetical protein
MISRSFRGPLLVERGNGAGEVLDGNVREAVDLEVSAEGFLVGADFIGERDKLFDLFKADRVGGVSRLPSSSFETARPSAAFSVIRCK